MELKTVILLPVILSALLAAAPCGGKEAGKMKELTITSTAFNDGAPIPALYTCEGKDVSPPLAVGAVPSGARSLALIVDDPDAPAGTWVHWVVWNIPPDTREISEGRLPPGAVQGKNDFKRNAYGGPCPPSGTHRYFFKLYALDTTLNLPNAATKSALEKAMQGHILARRQLMGTYRRR